MKEKGFTLVEILIYIALVSTLMLVVVGFARDILKVRNKITIESKVEQNARYAITRMVNEIRFAESISIIDNNTISMTVSDSVRNPVLFDLVDGVLYMSEAGGDPTAVTGNDVKVGDVLFEDRTTPNSADIIKITLTVSHPDTHLSLDSQATININTYVTRR